MPMDNVTLENTQQSISSRDTKSVASVMVNGKWVNLSDTLEQTNVKSDVGAVSKQVAEQQTVITSTVAQADSAVAYANDAIEKSKVNSQAIVAQGEAISEAKSAIDSATAEIQQAVANAASDAANIRADVAQVQNEVDTAKAANSASVEALKSDVSATKQDLADVHDSLTKAQAAAEESQKAIDKSIAQINSDIEQDRKDIASAQQANADTAKQLDAYSKQAQDQGKTIKSIQDKQDGFTATLADVQGNVTQVSDKVGGLSASLKDAQDNVASVKAQADQLSATLTDHTKSISTLTASAKELSSTLEDADGRLSKVEQTAQTNSSTLSDVQGDLSQVKQDATTLTSTLKDAQGNISTLQQKADSVSDQLTSAQGDIASLQTDVKGIKATLVSHDGDIHTLQADSKTLKDNMQDVQGNISTLQKTSTDVTSELQDHAGRISKVEQTASTLTNEFSDQDGRLSKVEQTATGTQQTVANQQGQINSIQTDVSGIHETITGQGNQITTINATLNGLDTKYEGVSGDLGKLKDQNNWKTVTGAFDANQYTNTARIFYQDTNAKNTPNAGWFYLIVDAPSTSRITQKLIRDNTTDTWTRVYNGSWQAWTKGATQTDVTALSGQITTNSTQITQNKQAIALKADQSTVDNLSGEVSQNTAQLKVQADQISSKVSSSDFKTLNDTVNGAISSIQKNSTAIDQTNKQISLKADQTEVDQVKQTATQNSSRLDVMDGQIRSRVTSTDVNNIVDSKGFATTNTVQSLVTQKADTINESITNLDAKYSAKDGVNLQQGTKDFSFQLGTDGNPSSIETYNSDTKMLHTQNGGFYTSYSDSSFVPTPGEFYTFSADVKGDGTINGSGFRYEGGNNGTMGNVTLSGTWQRIINTVHVDKVQGQWVIYPTNSKNLYVKHIKIEHGTVATPWTPAPSDNATVTQVQSLTASIDGLQSNVADFKNNTSSQITQLSNLISTKVSSSDFNNLSQSVNLQTLDSADINNMKTNGHYFVHNLANTPIPGWVYVDVVGNGNDRIRQDVYQDQDNQHCYRRWNGSVWTAWSKGATESEITQLSDAINLRVAKGDVISQINQEAGGNTLIQVNNGNGSLILDAGNTIITGKAWIPSAAIANLTADQVQAGTLSGSKVHAGDNSGNAIDMGVLSTDYVGFHSKATNGDQTYIDSNGIHNYGATYDTRISQGKITTNLLAVNGGGLIDFRDSTGTGMTADGSKLTFYVNNASAGYLSYNGMPVAELPDGSGGNEIEIRYGLSTAIIPDDNSGAQATFSKAAQKIAYMTGTDRGKQILSGLEVHSNNHHWLCAVNSDATCNRFEVNDRDGLNIAWHDQTHLWISDGNAKLYKDYDDGQTATKLEIHGWAWINGWVEAAGHSQHSTLSSKTRIEEADPDHMLDLVNNTELTTFAFKSEVAEGTEVRHIGPIIDDVNDVAQYRIPVEFIAPTKTARDDDNMIGALFGAVQALTKRIKTLESKVG